MPVVLWTGRVFRARGDLERRRTLPATASHLHYWGHGVYGLVYCPRFPAPPIMQGVEPLARGHTKDSQLGGIHPLPHVVRHGIVLRLFRQPLCTSSPRSFVLAFLSGHIPLPCLCVT